MHFSCTFFILKTKYYEGRNWKGLIAIAIFWLGYEFHVFNEPQKISVTVGNGARVLINKKSGKAFSIDLEKSIVDEFEA